MSDDQQWSETLTRRTVLAGAPTVALLGGTAAGEAPSSATPPEDPPDGGTDVEPHWQPGGPSTADAVEGREFLIVKDCNAWYAAANEIVLSDFGVAYQVINSTGVSETDLTAFTDVVLVSTQPASYYDRLGAASDDLQAFVEDGGTLHAHVATSGYPCTTRGTGRILPGGVGTRVNLFDDLEITATENPIVEGINNLDGWNRSTHGWLTNLPESATVIAGFQGTPTDRPTFAEYGVGDGTVLATTQTVEWPFFSSNGTRTLLFNDLAYTGGATGGTGGIDELLTEKDGLIDEIQGLAAEPFVLGSAPEVDARAQQLVGAIDDDAFDADTAQYEEALERMIAAEDVTRTATETVTGEGSVTRRNLRNLYGFAIGGLIELIDKVTGGVARRVANSIISSVARKTDDVARALKGRTRIPDEQLTQIQRRLNEKTTESYFTLKGFANENPDETEEILEATGSYSLNRIKDAGEGIVSSLEPDTSILDVINQLYFEAYYFEDDWPEVRIPQPEELRFPDVDVSYDVPDEELPSLLRQVVPDTVGFDLDTPDLPVPDAYDDAVSVLEAGIDAAGAGGIDTEIDDSMAALDEKIGSLSTQDDDTRAAVREGATSGITGVADLTTGVLDVIEGLQDVLGELTELLEFAVIATVAAAVAAIVTGVGTLGLLGVAGTIASISGALSVIKVLLDGVQVVTGQAYLNALTVFHGTTVPAIAESDLGGVSL